MRLFRRAGLAALLFACLAPCARAQSPVAFRIPDREFVPEGIAYDPHTKTFYVGSTHLRKIASVDARGAVRDFTESGQDGLRGVLGLRVDARRRVLWAVSSDVGLSMPLKGNPRDCLGCSAVHKYDLRTGKLIKKYELPNNPARHFLNDLTLDREGNAFITDTLTGGLYRIGRERDALELFTSLGPQSYPNGIDLAPDGGTLFVGTNNSITAVGVRDKSVRRLRLPEGVKPGIDGLYFDRGALVAVEPFDKEKIVRYILDAKAESVARVEIVEAAHPLMSQPTTGVIVGRDFYYIANSQLQVFRKLFKPDAATDLSRLSDYVVLKLRL
jgi:sugar lactone lactonase YvrE